MRPILSILLSALLALSCFGTLPPSDSGDAAVLPVSAPAAYGDGWRDVDWADMDYVHYDASYFYEDVDRLAQLSADGDGQAVTELYDELYGQFVLIDTLSSIAYIRSDADLTDEYWSGESRYAEDLRMEAANALSAACHQLTAGPCADAFAAHVGQDAFDAFAEYVPMTERESELLARQAELVDEYYRRMNDMDQVTYEYLGESWNMEKLNGVQGQSLAYQDYEGYLDVFYGLQQAIGDTVAPIFLQLVQLRGEIAGIEGWDSYASLAYEQMYGRDYAPEDAQALCDAVKAAVGPFYGQLTASRLWYDTDSVYPVFDPEQQLELVGRYAARLDPALEQPYRFLTEHGLYDLDLGEDRSPSCYTISLSRYGSAFIFASPGAGYDGLRTLSHEFGHFANDYFHPVGNILTDVPCYDLLEIHSTGLETLFTAWYDEIFQSGADAARFSVLGGLIEALIDGCLFDEFQRRVYAQPNMTRDEMDRLFASLSAEYGLPVLSDRDCSWVYVPHTFESPFYYLSYAAAALAAIQLWDMAQTDLDGAAAVWRAVMDHDASAEGYMTVLPACGLRLFTQEDAVADVCAPLIEELTRLDAGTG